MNKIIVIHLLVWIAGCNVFLYAQNKNASAAYTEQVTVHVNNDFLITGETLYFSIHCFNAEKRYSTLSKLVYVELIGENEKPFLQAKVPLVEGRGGGDFFLPSTLPSGNYTLIAYTKWMRNFPAANFFQRKIVIINPYLKPVSSELPRGPEKTITPYRSASRKTGNETHQLHLGFDKKTYSQRQKVVVVIKNNDQTRGCRISLNVHHYDKNRMLSSVSESDSINGYRNSVGGSQTKEEMATYLPDLRGETIGGNVKESDSDRPVANTAIYLSAPGSSFFQMARTDSSGRFYFSVKNIQAQNGIKFQIDRLPGAVPVEVIPDDEFVNDYRNFKPLSLSVDTTLRKQIEQRNIYSQIENAYFFKKTDSISHLVQEPFFGKPDKVYKLDDFTRFPAMEDIFREYMYEVVVIKRDGKFMLRLINTNSKNGSRFSNTPLMLVDGIRVMDTEILMNYNPALIKKVSLITRSYVYGGILFDGILSIDTYGGSAQDLPIPSIQQEYTSWQYPKKYYSPVYNGNANLQRIPDYRFQLYWNPAINIGPGQEFVATFYTSDLDGDVLIEVNGFNSDGALVNISGDIEVRK